MPDVYKACERFEKLGVNFVKKPDGGKQPKFNTDRKAICQKILTVTVRKGLLLGQQGWQ